MSIDTTPIAPPPIVGERSSDDVFLSDRLIATPSHSNKTRVLIIEESSEMRDHFKQFLSTEFELIVVATPAEAVSVASLFSIQIVIQDIEHEREFDAVLLSKQLRQLNNCKDAYFVSITGYVLPEGKSILKRASYNYHLTKPFTLRRLRELLRLCVAKQTLAILNGINIELDLPIGSTMMVEV